MSAPVTERTRSTTRSRTATIPTQRGTSATPRPGRGAGEPAAGRRSAQVKAYARRDDRLRRIVGGRQARTAAPSGRPQFVLLIMVLLAVGLVATLWLSTAAAADSYRLKDATAEARALSEQAERLHREVAVLASAPELARRATALGMTPVQDPARLVVAPDGSVSVVGEPRAAVAPPPPAPPAQPGAAAPPAAGPVQPDGSEEVPEEVPEEVTAPEDGTTSQLAAPGADGATDPEVDGGAAPETAEDTGESGPATGDGTQEPGTDSAGPESADAGSGDTEESGAQSGSGGAGGDTTEPAGPDGGGTDAG